MTETTGAFAAGFLAALVIGSLFEYVGHILMHRRVILGKVHTRHHKDGDGQGWLAEFAAYWFGSTPLAAALFAGAWYLDWEAVAWGIVSGGTAFAAFAAYAHQLQHDRPDLVFWMRRPVHHLHHAGQMWRHNFGISLDVWDRVFGTYKLVEWNPPPRVRRWRELLAIKWV
jgi:sterol desaturase/sphingolipid hydroxylase (fatty acid hydroxylase superfamily)